MDGIKFDKTSAKELKAGIREPRKASLNITLWAAGGVNQSNVAEYAKTGVDAIVTTSLYSAQPFIL